MDGKTGKKRAEFVSDHSSLLSLQPWVFRKDTSPNGEDRIGVDGDLDRFTGASRAEVSPRNVSLRYGHGRGRSCLKSKHTSRYSVKPVVSAGNCLIPQLYNRDFEFREYGTPTVRPLVITNGERIISRSTYDPSCPSLENGLHKRVDGASHEPVETVVGVPPLPPLQSPNHKARKLEHSKQDSGNAQRSCKQSHSEGSRDRMLLLLFGINIGVISTIISSRREVEKLNAMLKHSENLVQDLQEELEMKESLTVNELPDESGKSKELFASNANMVHSLRSWEVHEPSSFPSHEKDESNCLHLPESRGNSKLSTIEAELEAELERLELDMNSTSLEGRISALGEIDPDLIGDIVHGELRADMVKGGAEGGQADANRDSNGTSTTETHNANYAVSPRELSLRLHEVIQSRLEERVQELENVLRCSQKQIEFMEEERIFSVSQRSLSNSEKWPSPGEESSMLTGQDSGSSQPLCLNLSGDALSAYNEVYEEFLRIAETPDFVPSTTNAINDAKDNKLLPLVESLAHGGEGNKEDKVPVNATFETEVRWEQMISRSYSDEGDSDDSDDDDEEGKRLIQQIVERTKQGSPAVMNVQRMLFAMDIN